MKKKNKIEKKLFKVRMFVGHELVAYIDGDAVLWNELLKIVLLRKAKRKNNKTGDK